MNQYLSSGKDRGPGILPGAKLPNRGPGILPGAKLPNHTPHPHTRTARLLTILTAPTLLLSSCIDSREEIWLNPSGSGKARITVSLPASAITLRGGPDSVSSSIDVILSKQPGISSVEKIITTADKRSTIDVSFQFSSALDLSASMEKTLHDTNFPASVRHIIGKTSIQQDGLGVTGERVIDVGKAVPGSSLLAATAAQHRLQTILHLPITPSQHNATRVENNGRTLIWDIPLASALRSPHIQRIHVRAPAPLLAAILIAASLILSITFLLWKKRRIRLAAQAPA